MTAPPPFTGYTPRFEMPIIGPPPASFSGPPADHYLQLQIQLAVTLSGSNGEFVDFSLTHSAGGTVALDPTLFAMTGGFVRCYPPGTPIPSPDSFSDATRSVLVLTTWLGDIEAQQRGFPPDTPSIGRIYYIGIDAAATSAVLRAETDKMGDAALQASWKAEQSTSPAPGTTHNVLVDAHNQRVMAGTGAVFVDPGAAVGKAMRDAASSAETYRFALRMVSAGPPPAYVSPLPNFGGAPYYEL